MGGDSVVQDDGPDLETVLGALYDEDCRAILSELIEPRTARELLDRRDIPRSTLYRKLDRLTEATLVREGTKVRADGSHATRYQIDFDEIRITRETEAQMKVAIERPTRRADERLAAMWSEVRREI